MLASYHFGGVKQAEISLGLKAKLFRSCSVVPSFVVCPAEIYNSMLEKDPASVPGTVNLVLLIPVATEIDFQFKNRPSNLRREINDL